MRRPEINHFQVAATVADCKIPGDIIVRVRKEGKRERETVVLCAFREAT